MDCDEAIAILVAGRPDHPYVRACSEGAPNREAWCARAIARANGTPVPGRIDPAAPRGAAAIQSVRASPIPSPRPMAAAATPTDNGRPSAGQAVALTRAVARCQYRSAKGCGCSGARCALKRGAIVSHIDCFACVGHYPEG